MSTQTISAHYFDGRSARLHPASLDVRAGALHIATPTLEREVPLADVRLAEPFATAPAVLRLPDGACCEIPSGPARQALLAALGYRKSRVERWQGYWPAATFALAVLVALLALFYFRGVPFLADRIAQALPARVETTLGETALATLESQGILAPSKLAARQVAEVQALLPLAMPAHPRRAARVLVRDSNLGANAITLPDGTIVVTDGLVKAILADCDCDALDQDGRAQLLGVLGHEVGHIEHRHTTRALAGSSLVAALSATLFGDFSSVAAGVPALLTKMQYSHAMELDADDYGIAVLRRNGFSPLALAGALAVLQKAHPEGASLPRWLRTTMSYLATHPDTDERIARVRAAAR
jgi:Zn-dependent protease with chaperone function